MIITYKYKYKKYPAKAGLLKYKYHKFAHLDVSDVEHLSRNMALNETKTEFKCCFDTQRTYNDYDTIIFTQVLLRSV